jgi:hypothetical protein
MTLKIAEWNANGLCRHAQEIQTFIQNLDLDILLISETYFTDRGYIKMPNYRVYSTNHPDGTARGGSAIIIKQSIKHHELAKYSLNNIQATSVTIGELTIAAIYCPPRYNNKHTDYTNLLTLGNRFLAGGDFNAKNTNWGSRITTTKGRELQKSIKNLNSICITIRQPTYWPSDPQTILDFCIAKGIVGAFHGNLPQVTRLSSCFLDTGLGNLWEVPVEGSHKAK